MSAMFEAPGAMRSRLFAEKKATIGGRMLSPADPITKRIAQPKIKLGDLAGHLPALRDWLQSWKEEAEEADFTLGTTRKSSGGLRFSLPSSITFDDLSSYVAWMGSTDEFDAAGSRVGQLADLDERLFGMTRAWKEISQLTEPDFLSFVELLRWRRDNPEARPPVRALAIPGLDTKWIERNRGLVAPAFRLLGAFDVSAGSVIERLGFDTCDRMTVWFRSGETVGGITAFAPQVALRPSDTSRGQFPNARRAIIVENLTSFEMLELAPGDIAIFGQGAQAPAALGLMPWLHEHLDMVLYWGDMDGEGYQILSRARAALPGLRSILMSAQDARRYMDRLSIPIDPDRRPAPDHLTPDERAAYALTAPAGCRIEQERLPRADVSIATRANPFDTSARSA